MGLLTTLAGAAIDRRDGDSGLKGALVGAAAGRAIRALGPVGLAAVVGVAAWRGYRKRRGVR
jgi:hypothetical protein